MNRIEKKTSRVILLQRVSLVILLVAFHSAVAAEVQDHRKDANIFADRENSTSIRGTKMLKNIPNLSNILPQQKERIVGGTTVQEGAYPFFAQWMKGCGGSRKFKMHQQTKQISEIKYSNFSNKHSHPR